MAEALLQSRCDLHSFPIQVDSCALNPITEGQKPDPRAVQAMKRYNIDLGGRARPITNNDFVKYDMIFAMTQDIKVSLHRLQRKVTPNSNKLHLFTKYCKNRPNKDIPDPFYGDSPDFNKVGEYIESSCIGFIQHIYDKMEADHK